MVLVELWVVEVHEQVVVNLSSESAADVERFDPPTLQLGWLLRLQHWRRRGGGSCDGSCDSHVTDRGAYLMLRAAPELDLK